MNKKTIIQIILVITGCLEFNMVSSQQLNALSAKEKQQGWQLLFDGKDLKGWHSYLKDKPGKAWQVQNGSIVLIKNNKSSDKDFADLVSNAEFENFDLKLEWKLKPCGNSGIMFYVHESAEFKDTYETGPEMQVADRDCSPDSKELMHRGGVLYDLVPVDTETVTKGGEWNKVEIISNKGHLQFFLNGHKVVDTHMWDDHWKELVAKSKFIEMPRFATFHKGHIAFQGTEPDTMVWYRDIRIRKL